MKTIVSIILMLILCFCCACMDGESETQESDEPTVPGLSSFEGQYGDTGLDNLFNDSKKDQLQKIFEQMGFLDYFDMEPVRSEPWRNGYTRYYFSPDDCKCFHGRDVRIAVSEGESNNVMLFLEGGGAVWPGGGFAVDLDWAMDIGFKNRDEQNPLKDWNFVYVPYCDSSIHTGDNEAMYDGELKYHHGVRQTVAAVSLIKSMFPNPDKILVAGSSAGGFGTFMGWAILKSQFMDTKTYILNDSGVGFWNPDDPETWELMKQTWNLTLPEECTKCSGSIWVYLYELFMDLDPQVRIGMFTSYHDWIISEWFMEMDPNRFKEVLLNETNQVYDSHPDRYKRFFINGNSHTTYEFILPEGPNYEVRGTSMYEWIAGLINDEDDDWEDLLE